MSDDLNKPRLIEVSERASKVRARLCKLGPGKTARLSRDEVGAVLDLIGEANRVLNLAVGADSAFKAHGREKNLRENAEAKLERSVMFDLFEDRSRLWNDYCDWKKTLDRI